MSTAATLNPRLNSDSRLALYLKSDLEQKFKGSERLWIWLDVEGIYIDFVESLKSSDFPAAIVAFAGSYLETIEELDGKFDGLDPEPLLLYLPWHNPITVRNTPFYEVYQAGSSLRKGLSRLIEDAAVGLVLADKIKAEVPGLANFIEAASWLEQAVGNGSSQQVYLDVKPTDFVKQMLARLHTGAVDPLKDDALFDYWSRKVGMLESVNESLTSRYKNFAFQALGWLLLVEYVFDLRREPKGILAPIKEQQAFKPACKEALAYFKDNFAQDYCRLAFELESWPPLAEDLDFGHAEELGRIDTFSKEDQRLYKAGLDKIAEGEWEKPLEWANLRLQSQSIWLCYEPIRERYWQYLKSCAELSKLSQQVAPTLAGCADYHDVLELYASRLQEVDRAHRHFEQLYDSLGVSAERSSLGKMRDKVQSLYHAWFDGLGVEFNKFCHSRGFLPPSEYQQRYLYEDLVHPLVRQTEKIAYFMVDAMRYEMALELKELLQKDELSFQIQARLAELPTITKVGMNALAPAAQDGRLALKKPFDGFSYNDFTISTPNQRRQAMGHRSLEATDGKNKLPTDFSLNELLFEDQKKLKDRVKRAKMIVVSSREIDSAGENDFGFTTFSVSLGKLASAIRKLYNAGVSDFIITSDHGFGISNPKTEPIFYGNGEVFRRYALIEGGANPHQDTTSVTLQELSYEGSDQTLVFPLTGRSFYCRGTNADTFYHGGNSLQERVIPVIKIGSTKPVKPIKPHLPQKFKIRASLEHQSFTPKRLWLTLSLENEFLGDQLLLLDTSEPEVHLAFKPGGDSDPTAELILAEASGARIESGMLILSAGGKPCRVKLESSNILDSVRIYHPDGKFQIESEEVSLRLQVKKAPLDDWREAIANEQDRKILNHIDKYGQITENEIATLTQSNRAPRAFAKRVQLGEFSSLPFRLRIETGQSTTYIKE